MKPIQPILVLSLIILFISYFRWFRRAAFDKLFIAVIFIVGILLVLFPDFTTRVAVFLGVGRGTDLLLYTAIVSFSYILLLFYSKIKKLENQLVELVRHQAILGSGNFTIVRSDGDDQ